MIMLSARISVDGLEWLDQTAKTHGMSRSELVKRVLRHAAADYSSGTWRP